MLEIIRIQIRIEDDSRDTSTSQGRSLFHNLAHISGKADWIFMKILPEMYLWTSYRTRNSSGDEIPNVTFLRRHRTPTKYKKDMSC